MNIGIIIAAVLISLAIGVLLGIVYRKKVAESKINSAEEESKKIVNLAKIEAENLKKAKIIEAKEEVVNARNELDQEIKERYGITAKVIVTYKWKWNLLNSEQEAIS